MPAGNDKEAALSELADNFGNGVGRAEDLIAASRARYDEGLREAQLSARDDDATATLKEDSLGDVAKTTGVKKEQLTPDNGGDVAVRGAWITYVYTDEDGRVHKGAFLRDDLGKTPKAAEKNVEKATSDE